MGVGMLLGKREARSVAASEAALCPIGRCMHDSSPSIRSVGTYGVGTALKQPQESDYGMEDR